MGLVPHRDQIVSALAEGALQVNARSVGAQALDLDRPPEAVEEDDRVAQFFDHQFDAAFVQAGAGLARCAGRPKTSLARGAYPTV